MVFNNGCGPDDTLVTSKEYFVIEARSGECTLNSSSRQIKTAELVQKGDKSKDGLVAFVVEQGPKFVCHVLSVSATKSQDLYETFLESVSH